jgi:predicted nucleotidyltransferase
MKKNNTDIIIIELRDILKKEIGPALRDIILFGSRARGDSSPDSDYDILVLVDNETKEIENIIFNASCEIGWRNNVIITVFVHNKAYYDNKKYEPLFMNIRREGIHI